MLCICMCFFIFFSSETHKTFLCCLFIWTSKSSHVTTGLWSDTRRTKKTNVLCTLQERWTILIWFCSETLQERPSHSHLASKLFYHAHNTISEYSGLGANHKEWVLGRQADGSYNNFWDCSPDQSACRKKEFSICLCITSSVCGKVYTSVSFRLYSCIISSCCATPVNEWLHTNAFTSERLHKPTCKINRSKWHPDFNYEEPYYIQLGVHYSIYSY